MSSPAEALFSILIPTWNNLEYLKLCVRSIQENSAYSHQLILHINEGKDGTKEWVEQQKIAFTYSAENIGICAAMNEMRKRVKTAYVVYFNDDMYACPDWDRPLWEEVQQMNSHRFFLSATMIEPHFSNNNCVLAPYDFGSEAASFREKRLMEQYKTIERPDWNGATWPPNLVSKSLWDEVGGYSEEFSPGMYSDIDFSMKLWQAGVRYFKGIGSSKVYHFGTKSTERIKQNNGRKTFLKKWGLLPSVFVKYYLRRGSEFKSELKPELSSAKYKWAKLKGLVLRQLY